MSRFFWTLLICGVVLFFLLPSVFSGFNSDLEAQREDEDEKIRMKDDYVYDKNYDD